MRRTMSFNVKNIAIIIAFVVMIALLIISATLLSSSNFSAYADETESETVATTTYKQITKTESCQLRSNADFKALSWYKSNIATADSFEYIIAIEGRNFDNEGSDGLWFGLEGGDFNFMFGARRSESTNYNYQEYLAFGPYAPEGVYDNDYSFDLNDLYDLYIYLTVTDECVEFAHFASSADYLPAATEYDAREVLVSFASDSDEYKAIFDAFFVKGMTLNSTIDSDLVIVNMFRCYKEVEAPYKEGYIFTGWYYDEACTKPYQGEDITADVKLYAGFSKAKYKVTFDASALVDDSNSFGLYDWFYYVEAGDIAVYSKDNAGMGLPDIDEFATVRWVFEDGTLYEDTPIYENTVLYGRFFCTVTFDVNGGNEEYEPVEVEYGSSIDLPAPTRDKYGFDYWSIGGTIRFVEGTPVKENVNLMAEWYRTVFYVTFYVDDEPWQSVEVELGQSLFDVVAGLELNAKLIVGFENLNTITTAASLSEFSIADDIAVYIDSTYEIPQEPSVPAEDNTVKNAFAQFWDNVKAFFEKIAQWFKNLFSKLAFWKK